MGVNILYVENGSHGGGSAESLYQFLMVVDKKKYMPTIVFTSNNLYIKKFTSSGLDVVLLKHWYLSFSQGKYKSYIAHIFSGFVVYFARPFPRASLLLELALTTGARKSLASIARNRNISIIHTNNNPNRDFWAIKAASSVGISCVSHARSFHGLGLSSYKAEILNNYVRYFIGYSSSISSYWIDLGLDREKFVVVRNAIKSLEIKKTDLASLFPIDTSEVLIGLVGRIIPERGYETLFRSIPFLIQRIPKFKILIVGDGNSSYLVSLKLLVQRLGVSGWVIFTGHQEEALGITASLDVLVLPYTIEPFGRVLLEAWQLGIPVVLSRVGRIEDIVSDRSDAVLFENGNEVDLAEKLALVVNNPDIRKALVVGGKDKCNSKFRIEAYRDSIQSVYDSL